MIATAPGFIPVSPLSIILMIGMWGSSQSLGKNIMWGTGKKKLRKAWIGALSTMT